jgi:phosphonate transport system substrate-binding protein
MLFTRCRRIGYTGKMDNHRAAKRPSPNRIILITWGFGLFLVSLLLTACVSEQATAVSITDNLQTGEILPRLPDNENGWLVGFDRRLEPKEDMRQIATLTHWLAEQTGLAFQPYVTLSGGSVVDDLCAGRIDFAVVGTVSYLQAHDRCDATILVRGLNAAGEGRYRAAIIVPPDSPLHTTADLAGNSFAFGATNSTQGHLIPRLMLQQAGLNLDALSAYSFHDSHAATANAVTSGRFDAGALQDTLAQDLAERGLVRVLAYSNLYPSSGIVAGPDVPPETAVLVQNALLQLDPTDADANVLYRWERSEMPGGFVIAQDGDYDELREIATAIGLLEP